jgi:hypothetical protein
VRRIGLRLVLAAILIISLPATAAVAASPHFKHGGEPTCMISGTGATKTVTCTGVLAGLGNEDLLLNVTLSGFALYQCQNPGGNPSPGQNRVLEGPTTTPTLVESDQIKNGNLEFTAPGTLTAAATVSGAAAGCPNPGWTGVNPALTVTDITLEIEQPVGTTIFTCTASNPNGLSGTVALSC